MSNQQAEVVVIGGGPAGYIAALRAAQLGAKVILIEREKLGGVCINVGCIPTKAIIKSCQVISLLRDADDFGVDVQDSKINLQKIMQRKQRIVNRLTGGIGYLLKKNDIQWIKGEAKLLDSSTIQIKGEKEQTIKASSIILATGSYPSSIPLEEVEKQATLTSTQALQIESIPEDLLIVGAGAIGVEFAHIYNTLGSKVSVVEMLPRVLPGEDEECTEKLKKIMQKRGIQILTESTVSSAKRKGGKYAGIVDTPQGKQEIPFDKILISVGRKPNSKHLGLEKAGVEVDKKGWIKVDSQMKTTSPNIYAAGDVVGGYLLAHVAYTEGEIAAENAMGKDSKMNYRAVPRFTCSTPELAAVGLTEQQAKKEGYQINTGKFPLIANGKALIEGEREGMVKIISDADTGEILGMHILSPQATDLILEGTLALNLESTTLEIIETIHPHPALGEALREATLAAEGRVLHV